MSGIKLIIFDLWKTLAYKDLQNSTSSTIAEKFNLEISHQKIRKIFENSVQTKKWQSKYLAYTNLCKNLDLETTRENIKILTEIRDKREAKTKLYVHTIPMLKKLRKQGYKIGLISNTSVFSIKYVKKTGLFAHIDYPVFSFDVGVVKPELDSYKRILKLAKVKPGEAVMVGDKIIEDVLPPEKIRMKSIHFKNYSNLKKEFRKLRINI